MFSSIRQELICSYKEQLEQNNLKVENISKGNGLSIHADGSVYLSAWDNEENHCILNVYEEDFSQTTLQLRQMNLTHNAIIVQQYVLHINEMGITKVGEKYAKGIL